MILNISSAQMKQELQYFIITNKFSFKMFHLTAALILAADNLLCICALFDSVYREILWLAKSTDHLPQTHFCFS